MSAEFTVDPRAASPISPGETTGTVATPEQHAIRDQWRLIINSTAEGIYAVDLDGNCTLCNPACLRLLGYAEEKDLLGKNMHRLVHHTRADGSPYPAEECELLKAIPEGQGVHCDTEVLWRADGSSFPAEYWSTPLRQEGRVVGCVVVFADITQRNAAAEALRASEAKYRSIVNNVPDVVFSVDVEGFIHFASRTFEKVFGYSAEEVANAGLEFWLARIHPEDRERVARGIQLLLAEDRSFDEEYRIQRKDGCWIWGRGRAIHTYEKDGRRYADAIFCDITERRLLEEKFRQAQKMEAVGRLAGGVAHDFNNLLTIINGYSQLMQEQLAAENPLRGMAEQVLKAGERAASLTRQLLAFSRQQVLEPRVLELNEVATGMEKMLRRLIGEDIELRLNLGKGIGRVKADPGQIEQVILNLAVNARDAMPKGGTLLIETANAELGEAYIGQHGCVKPGEYVMLAVSDAGLGMDAETQSHIFEPFFTTKERGKGTGLGLSTVYGIVKQSGGYIWVYSEIGKGTTFKIYLPRVRGLARNAEPPQQTRRPKAGSETVLLVEDEEAVRLMVRGFLQKKGYRVLEAPSPAPALTCARDYLEPIHLLLTDVVMPQMSGPELAQRLAASHPETKIIYMSGYTDEAIVQHGVLSPGLAFLQKPFSPDQLASKISEVLDQMQPPEGITSSEG